MSVDQFKSGAENTRKNASKSRQPRPKSNANDDEKASKNQKETLKLPSRQT